MQTDRETNNVDKAPVRVTDLKVLNNNFTKYGIQKFWTRHDFYQTFGLTNIPPNKTLTLNEENAFKDLPTPLLTGGECG